MFVTCHTENPNDDGGLTLYDYDTIRWWWFKL